MAARCAVQGDHTMGGVVLTLSTRAYIYTTATTCYYHYIKKNQKSFYLSIYIYVSIYIYTQRPLVGGYVCAAGFVGTPALKCQVARFECQTNSERALFLFD